MFWYDGKLPEEEWSLSAKLIGGLLLNPFSLPNSGTDRLIDWFFAKIIGSDYVPLERWVAKPEYIGQIGRNDWVVRWFSNGRIVIECKFGDGIDPREDCLKYIDPPISEPTWVVLVATISEFSQLSIDNSNERNPDVFRQLREALADGRVMPLPWHQLIDAAAERLTEGRRQVLLDWANSIDGHGLRCMPLPLHRYSGEQIAAMLLIKERLDAPVLHKPDARGQWKSTSDLDRVCKKTKTPPWVKEFLCGVENECRARAREYKWTQKWLDVRRKGSKRCATLVPWAEGIALLVTHPEPGKTYHPDLMPYSALKVPLPDRHSNHFHPDRVIGIEITSPDPCGLEDLRRITFDLVDLL